MPNRYLMSILTLVVGAATVSACGPADAQNQGIRNPSAESPSTQSPSAQSPSAQSPSTQSPSTQSPSTRQAEAPSFFGRLSEPEPRQVEVPVGALIALRLDTTLSSHETPPGTAFEGLVTQETSVEGRVAVQVGSVVHGRVTQAHAAKKIGGRAILSLSFERLETPAGEWVSISAHLAQRGTSEVAKDAAIIGGGTIGGAIIGDAIHEGEGGTIGAIVGGIAGTVGALKTKGKPLVLPAGTLLTIELERSITLEESA